jgi:hypothetical protein
MPWMHVHLVSARIVVCIQPPVMRTGIRRNVDVGLVCWLKFPRILRYAIPGIQGQSFLTLGRMTTPLLAGIQD